MNISNFYRDEADVPGARSNRVTPSGLRNGESWAMITCGLLCNLRKPKPLPLGSVRWFPKLFNSKSS